MKRFGKTIILLALAVAFCFGARHIWLNPAENDATHADRAQQVNLIIHWICALLLWLSATSAMVSVINVTCWKYLEYKHNRPVPRILRTLAVFFVGMIMATAVLEMVMGLRVTSLWAASAVSWFGLILGLKETLQDLCSGVLLNLHQPFKIHEHIRVHTGGTLLEGFVVEMDWRTTKLRASLGESIIIPNSVIMASVVTNLGSESQPEGCVFKLQLDPEVPVETVRKIILNAIRNLPLVLKKPEPAVMVTDLHDWCIEYEVQFFFNQLTTGPSAAKDLVITAVLEQIRLNRLGLATKKHDILLEQKTSSPHRK